MAAYELIIRSQTQADIAEIVRWYEKREKGLGNYFLLCLDASREALKPLEALPDCSKSH